MSNAAEKYLKQVRKLPSNLRCPNCGSESTTNLGFGSVCVKFKTFICDLCKTSHQAISHRVKSVSMSEWTMEEVKELTAERSGGNAAALHTWLLNAPSVGCTYPGGKRPRKGDDVTVFKQFILDCYEHGKFRAETPFDPSSVVEEITSPAGSAATSPRPGATSPVPRAHPTTVPVRRTAGSLPSRSPPKPVASAAPAVNLLDMSDDPVPAAAPSQSGSNDDFFGSSGGFDSFDSPPNPNTGSAATDFDSMFGSSAPAPPTRDVSASSMPVDIFATDSFGGTAPQRAASAPIDPFANFGSGSGASSGVNSTTNSSNDLSAMIFGGSVSSSTNSMVSNNSTSMNAMGAMGNGMNRGNAMGSMGGGMNAMGGMGMSNNMNGSGTRPGMGNSMGGGMGNSMGGGMGNSMGGGMGNSMGGGMGNSMGGRMGNSMGGGMGNSMGGGMGNSMGGGMGNSMGGGMGNSMGGGMHARSQSNTAQPAGNSNMSSMMNNQLLGMNSMKCNSYAAPQSQGGYGGGYGAKPMGGSNTNVFDFVNNEMKKK
jgi:hypothetical protein